MPRELDAWLWPERQLIRWWTPAATGVLASTAPGNMTLAEAFPALRDAGRNFPMAAALEPELCQRLVALLQDNPERLCLHLAHALPESWHRFPFEYLSHQGRPLRDRLQVFRYAPCTANPPIFPTRHAVLILDLWPDTERDSGAERQLFRYLIDDLEPARVIRGFPRARIELDRLDLSAFSLLCVICHGSQQAGRPFQVASDTCWSLPSDRGLPPLVMLLVCGDDQLTLIDYGKTLLEAGARTILAPLGQLDARATDRFLRDFLRGWQAGQTVADLLWQAQCRSDSEYGARSLLLLGYGGLHLGPTQALWERSDKALAAAAWQDSAALVALIERITLRCYRNEGDLETAVDTLCEALGIDPDAAREPEKILLNRLDACEAGLWPLARSWVLPYLAYLAEAYQHSLMSQCERIRHRLDAENQSVPAAPYVYYFWGKIPYRKGHYDRAVAEVSKGFAVLRERHLCRRSGVGLLGLLVNCLIDLNLPEQALWFYDRLDACLGSHDNAFFRSQDINRLDRRARLALRRGERETALYHYQRKRETDRRDPARDLAGLLYAIAWVRPEQGQGLAKEVRKQLVACSHFLPLSGKGNATPAYLLRAYALWAWRTGDKEAANWLALLLLSEVQHLASRDPGPTGLALGFLHLYRQEYSDAILSLPPWELAEGALEDWGYWFELAILCSLLGRRKQARRFLARFHALREAAMPHLEQLPAWITRGGTLNWQDSLARRSADEAGILLAGQAPRPDMLVKLGLLPL